MICGLLLAAGRSRRMGTQKLLLPFGGSTVIGHIADELLRSLVDATIVVTGANGDQVRAALAGRTLQFVSNPEPEAEMLSSVRCGLAAAPRECEAVLLALGDQPAITHALIDQLIAAMRSSDRGIVTPLYDGHRGHPFLFSMRYRPQIESGHDAAGIRGLLDENDADVLKVPVASRSVLEDMDYAEDYRRALGQP